VGTREPERPPHRRRTSRRGLLGAGARAGVGALGLALVGCADAPAEAPDGMPAPGAAAAPGWFKDTAPFIAHDDGKSLEARLEHMRGLITPRRLFFVRNNSVSLDLDAARWRLSVEGDAVERPRELSYADLLDMPSRTLVSYLECAGNQRAMFDIVTGRAAGGTQWGTGGVSNGVWTGVSLWDVLAAAGVREDAVGVLLIGGDTESPEQGFRRVLPIEKARHPDTLLAYALNGEALPRDHGYPLRALVPGWVGSSSIKWLSRIVVSAAPLWTRNNTTSYVLIGDDYPPDGEALGTVVTEQSIKSALALPWPATLDAGSHRIRGYAQSPHGPITRVEWSDDGGRTWRDAAVLDPQPQYSWARFEFTWEAPRGEHVVMTRATDASGASQPDDVPFNQKGYLFNRPLPHPVIVA
jgi:DMSO/TMAO reductase YedYZ molybdopterin-dependent catalytic subunit